MTASSWIALGILGILLVAGAMWLLRWSRRQQARADAEAARTSRAEVAGWKAAADKTERKRSDEEALERWRKNFKSR